MRVRRSAGGVGGVDRVGRGGNGAGHEPVGRGLRICVRGWSCAGARIFEQSGRGSASRVDGCRTKKKSTRRIARGRGIKCSAGERRGRSLANSQVLSGGDAGS